MGRNQQPDAIAADDEYEDDWAPMANVQAYDAAWAAIHRAPKGREDGSDEFVERTAD